MHSSLHHLAQKDLSSPSEPRNNPQAHPAGALREDFFYCASDAHKHPRFYCASDAHKHPRLCGVRVGQPGAGALRLTVTMRTKRGKISRRCKAKGQAMAKNTICVWYDKDAEAAARFYAETFPDSSVGAIHRAPGDYPSGKTGDVLVVEFTVAGIPCIGLNGGPGIKHSEAFSFQIATEDQEETDRYWNAIVGNGGEESACGWCKDKWGVNWQITPRVLTEAVAAGGEEAKRAFEAMMGMGKIDVATIEAARRG
jgi:predicted 3-demethylubiquinone-9 3-methyltransferase (glyoxalase superfamily)